MPTRRNPAMHLLASRLAAVIFLVAFLAPAASWAGQELQEAASPKWNLQVLDAAAVSGDRLRLKEIAAPGEGFPEAAWKSIGETLLWKGPEKPGATVIIPGDKILNALRYYLRDAPLEFLLPNQTTVRRGGSVIYSDRIKTLVVDFLTPQITGFSGQASIDEIKTPPFVFLDGDPQKAAIEALEELKPGQNRLALVEVGDKGRAVRKASLEAEISLVAQVAVAATPINSTQGQITPPMIAFESMNLARIKGKPWDGSGGPWRVRTSVGQGQVVYEDNLEPMPTICRGDKVTLAYRGKRVQLSAEAEAITDGFLGQGITVRNLQSGIQVSGLVEGPGAVVVQ